MATLIADTACVDPRAELADDVEIGPYCIVGPDVQDAALERALSQFITENLRPGGALVLGRSVGPPGGIKIIA